MEEALPEECLQNLISLRTLHIHKCPLPQGTRYLTALQELLVQYFEEVDFSNDWDEMEWQGLRTLLSLQFLDLPKLAFSSESSMEVEVDFQGDIEVILQGELNLATMLLELAHCIGIFTVQLLFIYPLSEQRSSSVYVPRDEEFSEVKQLTFSAKTLKSVMHALLPQLEISLLDPHLGFPHFTAIDSLFCEGLTLPKPTNAGFFQSILPRLVKAVTDTEENLLLFETPAFIDRDKFAWFRDEEFSRQILAGLNPCSIQLVTDWPMKSKLDPKIYGPLETLITTELVEREIRGIMTINEALKSKRLFVLDYHDLLLPYVNKVREVEGSTLYGSSALFFLTKDGTIKPVVIELTRPPTSDKPQWKQVFTPTWDATGCWLWRLAKAHVCAHDIGYHQLVIHWLWTQCCIEPYIIAANRQLSAMHRIYRL
nr:linoleate 13s-lipoxygenase 2-1, chloroplastic [Quercus suber]